MDVLSEKQYKQYQKLSRYQLFPVYWHKLDEVYVQGTSSHLYDDTSYINHVVKPGETVDDLALYYYGNPTYYWIILDFNRIQNPFEELEKDTVLKIPTFSDIEFII